MPYTNEKPEKSHDPQGRHEAIVMPCPRLELEWIKTGADWRNRECIYSLVLPLGEYDIRRGEDCSECKAEIGRTTVTGGNGKPPISENGGVEAPFRDGAHSKFDAEALGGHIPRVAVCGDAFTVLEA